MKSLYVAHGSGLTHISALRKVKPVYDKIVNLVSQQNLDLGILTTDLFGNEITCNLLGKPIEEGDIWLTGSRTQSDTHMVKHMLRQTESDLRHQYDNYLSWTEEQIQQMEQTTQSAAVRNIVAEEKVGTEVGMMSAALKRSPAASVIFHSSIIRCVKK